MVKIRIFVEEKGERRELTEGPVPINHLNKFGVIVLTPMPEPIDKSRYLAVTFLPLSGKPQFLVHPGETLSFEVLA